MGHGKQTPCPPAAWFECPQGTRAAKHHQEKLGEKSDLDPTYISGIERGVRNPSILSIVRIAKALGSSVSEITKGIG